MAGVITAAAAELIAAIVIMTKKMPVRIFRIYEPLR